jgi:hypothetical protein
MEKIGFGIRDGKKSDPGSGINIPDPQHCFLLSWPCKVHSSWLLCDLAGVFSSEDIVSSSCSI